MTPGFRDQLVGGAALFGSFIKTPSPHATEILGDLGFDFVVIDAEHAPFERHAMDTMLLGARAAGIAALVRVPALSGPHILAALDDGAAGVLVPHIDSVDKARELVTLSRYAGRRGFSNSTRAGGYGGRAMWDHVDMADRAIAVIAMVEDVAGVDAIDAIVDVPGLDGVFIGRGDLAVALQDRTPNAERVAAMTERVLQATRRAGKAAWVMTASAQEAARLQPLGVRGFIVSSDQGFLRSAASQALGSFRTACAAGV
ncbi:HpcH/HpaI aldolase family protein [Hydrogenophaga sp. BPS33]|uniref:HpcH/HpaI aldolase family protein n=1 Tax=Hydrogenophaga sp. BPS33 TaxID=2651974 RepID=UPI00131F9027|nr:aldolase/citrate lyase family protein [Hydrogenophaga sp. BPS33]QHE85982.1 aldolase [Hydrogenophaga sp. BPS33]